MKTIKSFLCTLVLSSFLCACGGVGGGNASNSLPSNGGGNPGGGSGGGSPAPAHANAAYYGFNTQTGSTVTDVTIFQSGDVYKIDNHLAMVITDGDNRYMDALIYQPSCVIGLLEYDYNAILIKGANSAPSRLKITAKATQPVITTLVEVQSGTYGPWVEYRTETLTGTCSSGMFYDTAADSTIFQNGNSVIYKDLDGNIYFGLRNQVSDFSLLLNRQYKHYDQIDSGALNPSNTMAIWSSGNASSVLLDSSSSQSSFTYSSPNYEFTGFGSTNSNEAFSDRSGFKRIWGGQTSTLPRMGMSIVLGGKAFSIHNSVRSACSSPFTHNSQTVCSMDGAGSLSIYAE